MLEIESRAFGFAILAPYAITFTLGVFVGLALGAFVVYQKMK